MEPRSFPGRILRTLHRSIQRSPGLFAPEVGGSSRSRPVCSWSPMFDSFGGFHDAIGVPQNRWFLLGKIPSFEMDDDLEVARFFWKAPCILVTVLYLKDRPRCHTKRHCSFFVILSPIHYHESGRLMSVWATGKGMGKIKQVFFVDQD